MAEMTAPLTMEKGTTKQSLPRKQWRVPLHCSGKNLRDEKLEFYMAGTKATVGLLELERDNNGWALEDDDSSMNITIHSKYMDKWGLKIYRIEVCTFICHLNCIIFMEGIHVHTLLYYSTLWKKPGDVLNCSVGRRECQCPCFVGRYGNECGRYS